MRSDYDVIVHGTICIDAIWRVAQLAPPGGYEPILEERITLGGEAINTAMALHRWGVRVALVGNVLGHDADGSLFRELLAREAPGLDTRWLVFGAGVETPRCICIATPDGHRTMYGSRFGDLQPPPLDPDLARSVPWFTTEPNAWNAGIAACEMAAECGSSVIPMDYTREPRTNRLASLILTSSQWTYGRKTMPEFCDYAAGLRDEYGATTIVTCGERGCFVADRGQTGAGAIHVPAYVAPSLVDSTGAGDVFRAGLLFGLIQDWKLLPTVQFAAAAAALNCSALGGWGGVQSVSVIQAFQQTAAIHE